MGKNTEKKLKKADPSTEVKRPKDRPQELKDDSGIEKKRKKFRGKKKKADVKKGMFIHIITFHQIQKFPFVDKFWVDSLH